MILATAGDDVDPLTQLAIKHGTDKWGLHFYTPIYHAFFRHLRDKPVRLLEIGVGGYGMASYGGASLAMWADYFPQGYIVGIDLAEKRLSLGPRVQTMRGSQADPSFLAQVDQEHGPFDIIIDDGSHVPQHVATSFNFLFPKLRDPGLYVIEDVQTCFWPSFGGSVLDGGATMALARLALEHLNHAEIKVAQPKLQVTDFAKSICSFHAYHNIFVIEKGDNSEPSNFDYRLDNVHAARAQRVIETQLATAPNPAGYATLASMALASRDLAKTWSILNGAMAQWPDDAGLLWIAYTAAAASRDQQREVEYLGRLLKLEPDNAELNQLLQAAQARTPSSASQKMPT